MAEGSHYGSIHLARWKERDKSLRCPGCGGKNCFKEYLYEDGSPLDPVNHMCGRCDHESSCGYHLPPRDFFNDHPEHSRKVRRENMPPPKKRIMIEIPPEIVKATRSCYEINTFLQWLFSLPFTDKEKELLKISIDAYGLSTAKDGGVIYWQVDRNFKVRTGKKIIYNPTTGKRLKDVEGNSIGFNWAHSLLAKLNFYQPTDNAYYEMEQTLFGMHLTRMFPKASIHIAESEKSTVLMSVLDSRSWKEHIWLSCGGKYNLKEEVLRCIKDREIILYPDRDAVDDWTTRCDHLKSRGYNITISTKWLNGWTEADGPKADIADVALRRMMMTDEALFAEMRRKNPAIETLAKTLDLKITPKQWTKILEPSQQRLQLRSLPHLVSSSRGKE